MTSAPPPVAAMHAPRIRVLVVEDSPVVRDFLTHILNLVPDLQVVGVAHDGEKAIEMVRTCHPDVITMDIHMPKMDGYEATRRIMATQATPIVVVSGSSTIGEAVTAIRALEAGALAVIPRPYGFAHPEFAASSARLVETVRLMAGVKVVRRWDPSGGRVGASETPAPVRTEIRLLAIGASTGGPAVLATILAAAPRDMPFPVAVVQHICEGFTAGLAHWLAETSGLKVHVAEHGMTLLPGNVYVAPSHAHMGVTGAGRVVLDAGPPENGVRPAVSHLFRSVAAAFGPHAAAVLLTGMGADGAAAMHMVQDKGGVTVAQDKASSIVHGMPGEAIRMGAAMHVMTPEAIGAFLHALSGR